MVKASCIYSPQNFVEAITGNCYIFNDDMTIALQISLLLKQNGFDELWDYPLAEIDHIVENKLNVVLVDVSGFNEDGVWTPEYRWFQVPDDFDPDACE